MIDQNHIISKYTKFVVDSFLLILVLGLLVLPFSSMFLTGYAPVENTEVLGTSAKDTVPTPRRVVPNWDSRLQELSEVNQSTSTDSQSN